MPGRRTLLYDATWLGMALWARLTHDVELVSERPLELRPGTVFLTTHRSDADVPVVCGSLAVAARVWRHRRVPAGFTPRDDMFLPGFLGGYPVGVPVRLRRVLWRTSIGPTLRTRLDCLPIGRPDRMPLAELLRFDPAIPLDEAAPPWLLARLRERAERFGLPEPRLGADVLRGHYADLVWNRLHPEDAPSPRLEEAWRRRRREAVGEFRRVVDYVREGGSLLFFPEGTPSKDGSIGPLEPGIAAIVRHGRPRALRQLGIAYDPLTAGRPRAVVHVGPELEPPAHDLEDELLRLLRLAMPLTRGQLAARHLLAAGQDASPDALAREAAAELERARGERRAVEPRLADPALLARSLAFARAAGQEVLERLAREYESARSEVEREVGVGEVELDPE